MIAYLIKTTICAALLLLAYALLLEKAKMHRFNRFYLLFSLVFSFAVPFIKIKTSISTLPVATIIQPAHDNATIILPQPALTTTTTYTTTAFQLTDVLLLVYIVVTALLLFRFLKNLFALLYTIKHNPAISNSQAILVLLQEQIEPYTFLHFVFVNKSCYENSAIEPEILHHELVHVKQKHSIDILFIELLLIILWFNPVLYLYKKAIQLNHEFLADDAVTNVFNDTRAYQLLLLGKAGSTNHVFLTNHFNYSITKKRLIMLTKNTSPIAAACRQSVAMIVIAAIAILFSEKVLAQNNPTPQQQDSTTTNIIIPKQETKKDTTVHPFIWTETIGSTKEGVSQVLLDEYRLIINKYKQTDENWMRDLGQNITLADKERLITIFKQMNKEQQDKQDVGFVMAPKPLSKSTPTAKQFEAFKNPKMYGVWIDDKKVSNSVLQNYTNTDFAQVGVSKLYANARRNVNYYYQVNLSTKAYYQKCYKEAMARRQEPIMITVERSAGKKKDETILRSM